MRAMPRPSVVIAVALTLWLAPGRAAGPGGPATPSAPPNGPPAAAREAGGPSGGPLRPPDLEPAEVRAFRVTQTWEWAPDVHAAADEWGLSPWLLLALLWCESRLDPTAVNRTSGAAGLGQFTATGRRGLERIRAARGEESTFTRDDAFAPEQAIPAAAELLSWLTTRYGIRGGVAAYNGGPYRREFAAGVLRKTRALRLEAGLPPELPRQVKRWVRTES